jgi:hypothetical protein
MTSIRVSFSVAALGALMVEGLLVVVFAFNDAFLTALVLWAAICVGCAAVAVAENCTWGRPAAAAVTVFTPARGPRVQNVKALPLASVTLLVGWTEPPPPVITQFTLRPGTPLPAASCTWTTRNR